ncbi:MAG TPA: hypothetical protein PK788_13030, partial [Gemmatimonadaceae bacterium]|nr:hypothetical protein [Gemmatimonadaceae bacterium]
MALYAPIYRAEFYQPRTVDPTESAILTPPVGAPHSDPLRVATRQGVNVLGNDYKPYLISVSGRRGRLDPLRKRMDSGSITLSIGDVRTTPGTGSNAQRWLTAFTNVAKGAKVRVWESLDLGATWNVWWTGRVIAMRTTSRVVWEVTVEDMGADLKGIVFARRPHGSVSGYADVITHVPNSIPASNANERVNAIGLPVVPRPRATVNNASEGASYRSLSIKTESTYTTTV